MQLCVIGTGFVGVVSSAVFASLGNTVVGLDVDEKKVELLKQGQVPFFEPGLSELLIDQQAQGRLTFTTNYQEAISKAEVIIIAVGTPSAADGQADLKYVFAAADSLAPFLQPNAIIAVKSTVPPGTFDQLKQRLTAKTQTSFSLASLPEFLREGSAVADTQHPDRVLIGATEPAVIEKLKALHEPLGAPIIVISPASAQMAKYSANAYLATRITFINQIADLCEHAGADIQEVITAIGQDKRIGSHYWYPGFGYGGSCFPKDVGELASYSRSIQEGNNLFNKLDELNHVRIPKLLEKFGKTIGGWSGKKVAVLGLAFKPNTDDLREAPSTMIIPQLLTAGATVRAYDPKAKWPAEQLTETCQQLGSVAEACQDSDVIMAVIEWPEITQFDFSQVRQTAKAQFFVDGRNQFSPNQVRTWGFTYLGVGRS